MLGVTHIHSLDVMALSPANFTRDDGDDDDDVPPPEAAAAAAEPAPVVNTVELHSDATSDSDSDEFHDAAEEFDDPGCD